MRAYCTLFDRHYLVKGLALYRSLEAHAERFHLTVFAFDDQTETLLNQLRLPHLSVVALRDLEAHDQALARVKPSRDPGEYCWTATPSLPRYLFDTHPGLSEVTYLDADLMFFSDPEPLFHEMGGASVLITPHRFPRAYKHHASMGIYNVQFVTFRRTADGLAVLDWWRERCLEWCYRTPEAGRFGDQQYLDEWPRRFTGVHVLEHPGGGLAPWNALGHEVHVTPNGITVDGVPLVFFHYHGLRLRRSGRHTLHPAGYHVPSATAQLVYPPYLNALRTAQADVERVQPSFEAGLDTEPTPAQRIAELRERIGEHAVRRFPAIAPLRFRRP
jgi:hypothetical protein